MKYPMIATIIGGLFIIGRESKKMPEIPKNKSFDKTLQYARFVESQLMYIFPIPEPLDILAIIEVETGGNHRLIGKDGERGLMQVLPSTYPEIQDRAKLPFNFESLSAVPENGILAGLGYIYYSIIPSVGTESLEAIIKSYNAGYPRIKANGVSGIAEPYWKKFLTAKNALKGIYEPY